MPKGQASPRPQLLEDAEKQLDGVAIKVDQRDQLGRQLQQVGVEDDQVGLLEAATAAAGMRLDLEFHPPHGMAGRPAQFHHRIPHHPGIEGLL